jgi:hypothetical protein
MRAPVRQSLGLQRLPARSVVKRGAGTTPKHAVPAQRAFVQTLRPPVWARKPMDSWWQIN